MRSTSRYFLFAALSALMVPAWAADHRDGPLATGDPTADLNDIYLFVNPSDATELIIATTYVPAATANSRFSDAVQYRTFFDNGSANGKQVITCTFTMGGIRYTCSNASGSLSVTGNLNQTTRNGNMRVYAGLRDDPFFFDVDAFNRTRAAVAPRFTNPGVNGFGAFNTLALVFGIKSSALNNAGANPIVKVWGSTTRVGDIGVTNGITGHWYDSGNPGHGVVMEVIAPESPGGPDRLTTYWATYGLNGEQMWLTGVGNISGTRAVVPVLVTGAGRYPPLFTQPPTKVNFGTITFDFANCNSATMLVQPVLTNFIPVSIPLTRLTGIKGLPCSFLQSGQIDREGRPAINTALIDVLASTGKKDMYNRASDPATWAPMFQMEMQNNLTALDTLDGITGNSLLPPAALASVLVDDRLVVNTSIATCGAYLAVELGVAGQCGGRTLEADVIDDSLGAIVGPGVSDFVADDSVNLSDFPFLGNPIQP